MGSQFTSEQTLTSPVWTPRNSDVTGSRSCTSNNIDSGNSSEVNYDGILIRTLVGHERGIACLQFDGNLIVSGSSDQTIKLWNAHTGEQLNTLYGHKELVRTLQFDDTRIISGGYDQVIKVWDIKTGELLMNLEMHTHRVFNLQFNDFRIVSCSQDQMNDGVETQARMSKMAMAFVAGVIGINVVLFPFVAGTVRKNAIPYVATDSRRTQAIFAALNRSVAAATNCGAVSAGMLSAACSPRFLRFIDLGSGDGRVVLEARRLSHIYQQQQQQEQLQKLQKYQQENRSRIYFGFSRCDGVEVNSVLLAVSYLKLFLQRLQISTPKTRVSFSHTDLWSVRLHEYDVVMVFGDLRLMFSLMT
ncbi:hypothetical protein HK100_004420 [Physocladia obscura]|uniref:WD_REPEATS_REGION domain-containing protein n=1 Tax=Physocladia obscura TaxID=109957 RepID=A0AAD5XCM0_9FUNG|nr:hypothetical protein HK100_004420 [Physocladia obscura]